MDTRRWFVVIAVVALSAFVLGRILGPTAIEFSDPALARDADEMAEAVRDALELPNGFARATELGNLFLGLTPENAVGAESAFDARLARVEILDIQLFLLAWCQIDPNAALDAVLRWKTPEKRAFGVSVVAREWAARGGAIEILTFVREAPFPEVRERLPGPLVRGWAHSGDLEAAASYAEQQIEQSGQKGILENLVKGAIGSRGVTGAIAWSESEVRADPQSEFRRRAFAAVLKMTSLEAPKEAVDAFDRIADASGSAEDSAWLWPILPMLATQFAEEQPIRTLDWLRGKPAGADRRVALGRAMRIWSLRNLDAASEWVEGEMVAQPGEGGAGWSRQDLAALSAPVVKMLAVRNPPAATQWVDRFDGEARSALVMRISRFWARSDRAEAELWLDALDLDPVTKQSVRDQVAQDLAPLQVDDS